METPLSSTCSTLRAVGGKSSSGFRSRTREGGCQLSAGRVPAPRQVCGPLALGPAPPPPRGTGGQLLAGACRGAYIWHLAAAPGGSLACTRVGLPRCCPRARMRFLGTPGAAAAWTLCCRGRLALGPAPRGVCSPRVGGEPPRWRPRCLTFVTVLAGVAHFTGAAVGPVAGQAVAAASTGV